MTLFLEKLEACGISGLHNYVVVMFICCIFIILSAFVDMWAGIDAAKANKESIDSKSLRRTVSKVVDYFRVLVFGAMIDGLGLLFPWYVAPYCMVMVTVGIIVIECKSVMENSRKKKSHAAEITDVIRKIIDCVNDKDAAALIEDIKRRKK